MKQKLWNDNLVNVLKNKVYMYSLILNGGHLKIFKIWILYIFS